MEQQTSLNELYLIVGRLEGTCDGYGNRLDVLSEKIDDLAKEVRHHHKQTHGNFDWRILGGLMSGGILAAGFLGAYLKAFLFRGG